MAEVVLDANVLVALLYADDVHPQRARALVVRLEADGHVVVALDFLVHEAVSALCRRTRERKTSPPDLLEVVAAVRGWFDGGYVRSVAKETERLVADVFDVIEATGGA
jgi:predicted nucleic acid-binding protein